MGDANSHAAGHRERLRQRLLNGGPEALHDYELIEYLLGLAVPRRDTKPLAKTLIEHFGGIGPLLEADAEALREAKLTQGMIGALKIAKATAERLLETRVEAREMLSSWEALGDYLQAKMGHSKIEEVRVLFLNSKNVLIANQRMWDGSVDESAVHVREIIKRAIAFNASALIIVHNHPSGDPTPSSQDIALTRELIDAARHMKIAVHDHVIVASTGRSSLRAMGLI
jgi:DNA repair protein RadC